MYLMEPWMFSVQLTSHVTVLSCRTSFQLWPSGGTGIRDSLSMREVNNELTLVSVNSGRLCMVPYVKLLILFQLLEIILKTLQRYPLPPLSHALQLMMMSSGWILFFSMPCFGCSPLPRKRPGGSILKLPMRSLWWSNRQYPNSSTIFWLASFIACEIKNDKPETTDDYILNLYELNITDQLLLLGHVFSGLHLCFMHGMKLTEVTFDQLLNQWPFFISHFLVKTKNIKYWTGRTLSVSIQVINYSIKDPLDIRLNNILCSCNRPVKQVTNFPK